MRDIEHRSDLEVLLRAFYEKLLDDPEVGYIFTTIAKIDLEPHLVHIVDFWEQTLFNKGSYRNNVLQIHQDLNSLEKLTSRHFEVWLSHFTAIIDNMFTGEVAEKMKTRALSIATVMQMKLHFPAK